MKLIGRCTQRPPTSLCTLTCTPPPDITPTLSRSCQLSRGSRNREPFPPFNRRANVRETLLVKIGPDVANLVSILDALVCGSLGHRGRWQRFHPSIGNALLNFPRRRLKRAGDYLAADFVCDPLSCLHDQSGQKPLTRFSHLAWDSESRWLLYNNVFCSVACAKAVAFASSDTAPSSDSKHPTR